MADEIWERQHKQKYRDHDIAPEELSLRDIDRVRESAQQAFVQTKESDNVRLIVNSFMGFLTSKGYRITKKAP